MTTWPGATARTNSGSERTPAFSASMTMTSARARCPRSSYTTLPQFIYGVASTATKTFPTTANEPFNFLNLDLYAQDTWKVTRKLTWTFGIRDTFNSNPLNPHQQIARLERSFDSISHDVNQPLERRDSDASRQFVRHPRRWPFSSRERPSRGSSNRKPCCEPASESSATSCPAASPTSWA